jgi:hypothetical protein
MVTETLDRSHLCMVDAASPFVLTSERGVPFPRRARDRNSSLY